MEARAGSGRKNRAAFFSKKLQAVIFLGLTLPLTLPLYSIGQTESSRPIRQALWNCPNWYLLVVNSQRFPPLVAAALRFPATEPRRISLWRPVPGGAPPKDANRFLAAICRYPGPG